MKKAVVVDSSVAVKWVNSRDEKYLPQSDKILRDFQNDKLEIFAPELVKYEVGNALLYKGMDRVQTENSFSAFYNIPVNYIPLDPELAYETIMIAREAQITFYDAAFLSLARKLKAKLITDNPKHQKKVKGWKVKVVSLKNYR